jgi:hypothetical protein
MMAAIAAAVVIAISIGAYLMTRDKTATVATTTTGAPVTTATTAVTATAEPAGRTDQGVLLLSATPWGDIEKIINTSNQQVVQLSDEDRSTPKRLDLDPGNYAITLKGPNKSETINVEIEAGKIERKTVAIGTVNYDELAREVSRP